MKLLYTFDGKDYDETWSTYSREAVRAVIMKEGKIALVKSKKEGYYKFPGGGREAGESRQDTLVRETLEETGLHILPQTIRELGMLLEIRKSIYEEEIFEQKSYYYYADTSEETSRQALDEYEQALGFTLEWTDIASAYLANKRIKKKYEASFLQRESYMLQFLTEYHKDALGGNIHSPFV